MKRRLIRLFLLLGWALLIGGGLAAYEAYRFLSTPGSPDARDVVIAIAPGATFDRVAWDLKKAGAITDVTRFRLLAQARDALGRVRAGEFMVNTGWTPEEVLRQITEGRELLYRLSVREGLTWWETARAVEEQGFALYEDFKAVIHDPAFLREHHIPFANAEGFLFPETYLLQKPRAPLDRQQAYEVASTMVGMFWKKTEPLWAGLPARKETAAADKAKPAPPGERSGAMRSPPPSAPLAAPVAGSADAPPGTPADSPPVMRPDAPPPARAPGAAAEPAPQAREGADKAEKKTAEGLASAEAPSAAVPGPAGKRAAEPASVSDASGPNASVSDGPASDASVPDGPGAVPASAASASVPSPLAGPAVPGPASPADIDPEALRRLVILASLVEKETGVPSERGLVAGVYANRLRLGMLLQCDPTIIYGIGEGFRGAILRSQLDDPKNPYNTYQHPGLPPGPICSSGLEALQAASAPTEHGFFYFVATGADAGHTFSKTLEEHNKAVRVYRSRVRGNR